MACVLKSLKENNFTLDVILSNFEIGTNYKSQYWLKKVLESGVIKLGIISLKKT